MRAHLDDAVEVAHARDLRLVLRQGARRAQLLDLGLARVGRRGCAAGGAGCSAGLGGRRRILHVDELHVLVLRAWRAGLHVRREHRHGRLGLVLLAAGERRPGGKRLVAGGRTERGAGGQLLLQGGGGVRPLLAGGGLDVLLCGALGRLLGGRLRLRPFDLLRQVDAGTGDPFWGCQRGRRAGSSTNSPSNRLLNSS